MKEIREKVKQEDSDDIVMTFPFDEQTLTWKTDSNRQVKPSFRIANNVHRIQSKEVLCNYLHQVAGYPVKKTWL